MINVLAAMILSAVSRRYGDGQRFIIGWCVKSPSAIVVARDLSSDYENEGVRGLVRVEGIDKLRRA